MTLAPLRLAIVSSVAMALCLVYSADSRAAETFNKPIYNPETKSYFELRIQDDMEWQGARRAAESHIYKGVRGRLAIVSTPEVHSFLQHNFEIKEEAWIGLRYWCTFRKLQWVTGKVMKPEDFGAWHPTWHRPDGIAPCEAAATKTTGYMSVYYQPSSAGFKWQAVGSAKKFKRYFVEYPTGAP